MEIKKIDKKVRLESLYDSVRYQIYTELVFLRKQVLLDNDLLYLTLLAIWGEKSLKEFCNDVVTFQYGPESLLDGVKHPVRVQSVRNRCVVLEKKGYVVKKGRGKKFIALNPAIPIQSNGSILLNYNFIYVEA